MGRRTPTKTTACIIAAFMQNNVRNNVHWASSSKFVTNIYLNARYSKYFAIVIQAIIIIDRFETHESTFYLLSRKRRPSTGRSTGNTIASVEQWP